jgi:hypothetical protein
VRGAISDGRPYRDSNQICHSSGTQSQSYAAKFYKTLKSFSVSEVTSNVFPAETFVITLNLCEKSEDRMSILKLTRLCVPATALLVGCKY